MPNIAIIGYNIFGIGGTTRSNLNLMHEFDHSEYQLAYYNYTEFGKRDVLSLKNKYPYTSKVDFRFFLELYNLEPKQSYDYIFLAIVETRMDQEVRVSNLFLKIPVKVG